MLSIYDLKPRFQTVLRPIVLRLSASGVTANQVTIGATFLSVFTGLITAAILQINGGQAGFFLLLYPPVLLSRMALNAIDGMLAREFGQKSDLGAMLNELCDVVSDAALFLPFAWINGISGSLIVFIVVAAAISELAGVVGFQYGSARRYDGPMGKSDRAFFSGLLALLLGLRAIGPLAGNLLLAAVLFLIAWTVWNRIQGSLSHSGPGRPENTVPSSGGSAKAAE